MNRRAFLESSIVGAAALASTDPKVLGIDRAVRSFVDDLYQLAVVA